MPTPRRGSIVTVAGGVYASKPRPAVVIQDDHFRDASSVTVCPMTTSEVDAPLLRMLVPSDDATGIQAPSYVMIDKITTVRTSNVGESIGQLSAEQLLALERRIMVFLGLAH